MLQQRNSQHCLEVRQNQSLVLKRYKFKFFFFSRYYKWERVKNIKDQEGRKNRRDQKEWCKEAGSA